MSKAVNVEVEAFTKSRAENEKLIKKFSRKVKKSGLLDLLRDRRYYEKPSSKRKKKRLRKKRVSQEINRKKQEQ